MDEFVYYLKQGACELGVALSEPQIEMFCAYKTMLVHANRFVNLTSITDDQGDCRQALR